MSMTICVNQYSIKKDEEYESSSPFSAGDTGRTFEKRTVPFFLSQPSEQCFRVTPELLFCAVCHKFHVQGMIMLRLRENVEKIPPEPLPVRQGEFVPVNPMEYVYSGEMGQYVAEGGDVVVVIPELVGLPVQTEIVLLHLFR